MHGPSPSHCIGWGAPAAYVATERCRALLVCVGGSGGGNGGGGLHRSVHQDDRLRRDSSCMCDEAVFCVIERRDIYRIHSSYTLWSVSVLTASMPFVMRRPAGFPESGSHTVCVNAWKTTQIYSRSGLLKNHATHLRTSAVRSVHTLQHCSIVASMVAPRFFTDACCSCQSGMWPNMLRLISPQCMHSESLASPSASGDCVPSAACSARSG